MTAWRNPSLVSCCRHSALLISLFSGFVRWRGHEYQMNRARCAGQWGTGEKVPEQLTRRPKAGRHDGSERLTRFRSKLFCWVLSAIWILLAWRRSGGEPSKARTNPIGVVLKNVCSVCISMFYLPFGPVLNLSAVQESSGNHHIWYLILYIKIIMQLRLFISNNEIKTGVNNKLFVGLNFK